MMIVVAHGMYIDDILWFVIPVAGALWFLRWSERRARDRAESTDGNDGETSGD
jgi:hypothetical protein